MDVWHVCSIPDSWGDSQLSASLQKSLFLYGTGFLTSPFFRRNPTEMEVPKRLIINLTAEERGLVVALCFYCRRPDGIFHHGQSPNLRNCLGEKRVAICWIEQHAESANGGSLIVEFRGKNRLDLCLIDLQTCSETKLLLLPWDGSVAGSFFWLGRIGELRASHSMRSRTNND